MEFATPSGGFLVPVSARRTSVRPPNVSEQWADIIDFAAISARRKIEVSDTSQSATSIMAWAGNDHLVYGGNKRVYVLDLLKKDAAKLYTSANWRNIAIHDFDVANNPPEMTIVGSTFVNQIVSGDGSKRWSSKQEIGDRANSDWNRVASFVSSSKYAHFRLAAPFKRKFGLRLAADYRPDRDVKTSAHKLTIYDSNKGRIERSILYNLTKREPLFRTDRLSWSPTGQFLGLETGYVKQGSIVCAFPVEPHNVVIDMARWRYLPAEHEYAAFIGWHPTMDMYATTYCSSDYSPPFGFRIIDAKSKNVLLDQQIQRSGISVSVDWSPDGRYLALGGYDHDIIVWDFENSEQLRPLTGHSDNVQGLHFSPDGSRLASSDGRKTIIRNMTNEPSIIDEFEGSFDRFYNQRVNGSPWSPHGNRIAVFHGSGVRVRQIVD